MTIQIKSLAAYVLMITSATLFSSCYYTEDPGPIQEIEEEFSIVDFDRLEMGDALYITVVEGNFFKVSVRGDRRNVNDLLVTTEGSTLVMCFDENRNRRHDTYVTITMPVLLSANFSGASDSRISGFQGLETFDMYLSGASVCQLDVDAAMVDVVLSGASYLNIRGTGEKLSAELTGASALKAFNFPVTEATIVASGASDGNVTVTDKLDARASGASEIRYRGNPVVTSDVSGSSNVRPD